MGLFSKIKNGLKKTSNSFVNAVGSVLSSFTKIDEELFEELEESLILSDVGVVSIKELCYFTGYSSAVISALENKNIIRTFDRCCQLFGKRKCSCRWLHINRRQSISKCDIPYGRTSRKFEWSWKQLHYTVEKWSLNCN